MRIPTHELVHTSTYTRTHTICIRSSSWQRTPAIRSTLHDNNTTANIVMQICQFRLNHSFTHSHQLLLTHLPTHSITHPLTNSIFDVVRSVQEELITARPIGVTFIHPRVGILTPWVVMLTPWVCMLTPRDFIPHVVLLLCQHEGSRGDVRGCDVGGSHGLGRREREW